MIIDGHGHACGDALNLTISRVQELSISSSEKENILGLYMKSLLKI